MSFELNIVVANHVETLADAVAELVASPSQSNQYNPLQPETILIQSKGMQSWLSMAIAERQGICANINFPFPNTFLEQLYSQVVGPLPQEQLFDPKVVTFRIMDLLPQLIDEPQFAPIHHYLKALDSSRKQFQLASKIADVFDQYQIFRPEMILGWERGDTETTSSAHSWQPILWKKLIQQDSAFHRVAMHKKLIDALTQNKGQFKNIPPRISVFGISHLPPFHLQVLEALSQSIPVYLFLLNPCRLYWGDILSDQQLVRARSKEAQKDVDPSLDLHLERGNRLLASWGGQGKQFFNLIHQMDGQLVELFNDSAPLNLLGHIQQDILNLNDRSGQVGSHILNADMDTSLQIHACHSPMREVEVLYDQLLDLFEKDASMEARDVLVMTPDITTYAPYIHAVFGNTTSGKQAIPYTVADQGMPKESRLIEGFLQLLELYQSRFPASQVMALLSYEPIRERFRIKEEDLVKIENWLQIANVRWGWDAAHRRSQNLPRFKQNSWSHGLDRLVLGHAMAADGQTLFEDILPQAGVDASENHLLGALAAFVEKLFHRLGDVPSKSSMEQWHGLLIGLLEDFLHLDESTAHDIQVLKEVVDSLLNTSSAAGFTQQIPFEVVRDILTGTLNRSSFGTGFMAGSITFCAMLPMRSIPAKVICLLGMGYDNFPHDVREPAFNLAAANPRPGDRSKRDDDKYLFLEALISARQVLYLSFVGRSVQDNSPIPPSVVIDELLEYVGEGFGVSTSQLLTVHPLQAFSERYFDGSHPKLFSYSKENLEASRSKANSEPVPPFFSSALDEPDPEWRHCAFDQLSAFYSNPTRYLLEKRLAIYLRQTSRILEDQENFNIDGLDRYKIKNKMLNFHLEGGMIQSLYPAVREAGTLPHGSVGKVLFKQLQVEVEQFIEKLNQYLPEEVDHQGRSIELNLKPFDLRGYLGSLQTDRRVVYRMANTRPQDLLSIFLEHLAMASDKAEQWPTTSLLVCQDAIWQFSPVNDSDTLLRTYLEIYWQGLSMPIPLFPKTSFEYALQRFKGKPEKVALAAALRKWLGSPPYSPGESKDPYHQMCVAEADPLTELFEELASKVFHPLLACATKL